MPANKGGTGSRDAHGRFLPGTGRFQSGVSGNPGGRPKIIAEIRDLARAHTTLALRTLVEICRDKGQSGSARVAAATALLERGWGRAVLPIELHPPEPIRIFPPGTTPAQADAGEVEPVNGTHTIRIFPPGTTPDQLDEGEGPVREMRICPPASGRPPGEIG